MGVFTNGVLDDGGEGELGVWIGCGYFDATKGFGECVCADKVGFVAVREREVCNAIDGDNSAVESFVEGFR